MSEQDVSTQLRSPLALVTREPRINRLIEYLVEARQEILAQPERRHTLQFDGRDLEDVREAFARMIRQGERKLHVLAERVCETLFEASYDLESVVVGEIEGLRERFVLSQPLSRDTLYGLTDLDLGNRQLSRIRFLNIETPRGELSCHDTESGAKSPEPNATLPPRRATLVANFVEYYPHAVNSHGVHKIISRIKAEEQLWNKVVDDIFDLDELVRRDKQLRHLGRFVKDIFGLKMVVGDEAEARQLNDWLHRLHQSGAADNELQSLECIEIKDYLGHDDQKRSGWQAIKTVVRWGGETFEVQIQPLPNYHRERERLTEESHAGFKRSRETLRQQIAAAIPLFGFYQALLRWLFASSRGAPPVFNQVEIILKS